MAATGRALAAAGRDDVLWLGVVQAPGQQATTPAAATDGPPSMPTPKIVQIGLLPNGGSSKLVRPELEQYSAH